MGYTTEFAGSIKVEPPLTQREMEFLKKFSETRRMKRKNGPYFVDGSGFYGQGADPDIISYNDPPNEQPGLWCQWTPTDDGTTIEWNGGEKFYNAVEWMEYLIRHFIGTNPIANAELPFLSKHTLNGTILAQGEDITDRWKLLVENNVVNTIRLA